jgi:uncharacterized protein YegL
MKKISLVLAIFFITFSTTVFALEVNPTVELIESEEQLNQNIDSEFLIVHQEGNKYYALQNDGDYNNSKELIFSPDGKQVHIDGDNIRYSKWVFGYTNYSIANNLNTYSLAGIPEDNYGNNNDKLFLIFSKKSSSDPTALSYSNDAYPVTVKFSDGYVRISQYRVDKNQTWYFRYLASDNRFLSDASSKQSKTLRLFRIVDDNFKYDTYKSRTNSSSVQKNKVLNNNFTSENVYQIDLGLNLDSFKQDTDFVFLMDYSNSVIFKQKIAKMNETVRKISIKLKNINPNNRFSAIQFTSTYQDECELSDNLDDLYNCLNDEYEPSTGGTNYSLAFGDAEWILNESEHYEDTNRNRVVIFLTDGAPTIYNSTKYTAFKSTTDSEVGHIADNWSNYITSHKLINAEKLKQKGVRIISVGIGLNRDYPIASNGAYVIQSNVAESVVKNISSTESDYISVDGYDDLDDIMSKVVNTVIGKEVMDNINDQIDDGYELLIDQLMNNGSYISIKNQDDEILEKVTFVNGEEAYSNLLGNNNIKVSKENGYEIDAKLFTYDSTTKEFEWNIDKLDADNIKMTYFIVADQEGIVKGVEENPKTGIFNYLILLIPITLFVIFNKYINNKRVFKKM